MDIDFKRAGGSTCAATLRGVGTFALVLCCLTCISTTSVAADSGGKLELKTTAFAAGGPIPSRFTCSGANISPGLLWDRAPAGTQSFVLIVDDPDAPAGDWVHWVVYNLPATARQLPEHLPPGGSLPRGGMQGRNDFSDSDYGGPCPPPGKPHRYFFRLYALDTVLMLHGSVRRHDVDAAMKGHILAQSELMGTFGR